jgi:hypothetical protein
MADETPEALRAEIDHLEQLSRYITDARVLAEIKKMIEELEQRLNEVSRKPPRAEG